MSAGTVILFPPADFPCSGGSPYLEFRPIVYPSLTFHQFYQKIRSSSFQFFRRCRLLASSMQRVPTFILFLIQVASRKLYFPSPKQSPLFLRKYTPPVYSPALICFHASTLPFAQFLLTFIFFVGFGPHSLDAIFPFRLSKDPHLSFPLLGRLNFSVAPGQAFFSPPCKLSTVHPYGSPVLISVQKVRIPVNHPVPHPRAVPFFFRSFRFFFLFSP